MIAADSDQFSPITNFGQEKLDSVMIANAELFLVAKKGEQGCTSFDELRVREYYLLKKKKKRFITLPCSSDELQENIKRAYMQFRVWLEAPFWNALDFMDPVDYGYSEPFYEPTFYKGPCKPQDIFDPCTCKKCARTTCSCRANNISCTEYCNCFGESCKNPLYDS